MQMQMQKKDLLRRYGLITEAFFQIPPQRKAADARFALVNLQSQKDDNEHITVILKPGRKTRERKKASYERR
jgi:hypothetical protein